MDSASPRQRRRASCTFCEVLEPRLLLTWGSPGQSNVVDVVIISDRYTDMSKFQADAQTAIDDITSIEPYKSRSNQLAFHEIENTTPLSTGMQTPSTTVQVNWPLASQIVAASPIRADVAIILAENAGFGGYAGPGLCFASSSALWDHVAAHEFSHAFAHLGDEYVTGGQYEGTTPPPPVGWDYNLYQGEPPNPAWIDMVAPDEYTAGGTYPNWYKTSPRSLMSDLSPYLDAVSIELVNQAFNAWAGPVSDTPPSAAIAWPHNGDTVSGVVVVQTRLADARGVTRAQLWVDGKLARNSTQAPFDLEWSTGSVAPGPHQLQVKAFNAAGQVTTSSPITVNLSWGANYQVLGISPGQKVQGFVRVEIAGYPESIGYVEAQSNGASVGQVQPVPGTGGLLFDVPVLSSVRRPTSGTLTIEVHRESTAGNSWFDHDPIYTTTIPVTFMPAANLPYQLTAPPAGSAVIDSLDLAIEPMLSEIRTASVYVDGKLVTTAHVGALPYPTSPPIPLVMHLDTTRWADGVHTVTVKARGFYPAASYNHQWTIKYKYANGLASGVKKRKR